jgi:hypothetical protein
VVIRHILPVAIATAFVISLFLDCLALNMKRPRRIEDVVVEMEVKHSKNRYCSWRDSER